MPRRVLEVSRRSGLLWLVAAVALVVPREVDAAFDNFAMAAATAAGKVAEQAKETLVWYFVIAAVAVYALSRPGGPLASRE